LVRVGVLNNNHSKFARSPINLKELIAKEYKKDYKNLSFNLYYETNITNKKSDIDKLLLYVENTYQAKRFKDVRFLKKIEKRKFL
jgi:hypothetical protein